MAFFDSEFFNSGFFDTGITLGTKARPVATISAGAWLPSTGSDLHAMINSETPDDATHIYATTPTVSRYQLSDISLPALASRGLNYRTNGTGGGLAVRLYQGASLVAERIHDPVPATITQYTMTLTASELAAVTDETGLFVELEAEDAFVLRTVEAGDLRLTENNNIRILE